MAGVQIEFVLERFEAEKASIRLIDAQTRLADAQARKLDAESRAIDQGMRGQIKG